MATVEVQPQYFMFGRYRLVERLGAGGMAVVYRATVEGPGHFTQAVVIKRILPELSSDPQFVSMMLNEARLSALLRHPAIVQVYELGQVEGEYYIAMEYVEGDNLNRFFRRCHQAGQVLSPGLVCFIISELAGALAYAHTRKDASGKPLEIVHRDVSPSNVMVTAQGGVKLLDFGIARAAGMVRDEQTRTGTIKGKLSYMSPEQAEGLVVDRRSDIFALGIVFHECLTKKRLFLGEDDLHTLRLVRQAEIPRPSSIRPGIPPDVDEVVMTMLARDRNQRYSTGDEIVRALAPIVHRHHADASSLRGFLEALPVVGRAGKSDSKTAIESEHSEIQTTATERTVTSTFGEAPQQTSIERKSLSGASKIGRRFKWAIVGLSGLFFLGLGWRAWHGRSQKSETETPASFADPVRKPAVEEFPPDPIEAKPARAVAIPTPPVAASPTVVTPPPVPVAPVEAPRADPAAPAPKQVRLSFRGTKDAEITIDGRVLGHVPADIELSASDSKRSLTISHAGYRSFSQRVAGDQDLLLNVTLHEVAKPKPKSAVAPSSPRRPSSGRAKSGGEDEPKDPFAQ